LKKKTKIIRRQKQTAYTSICRFGCLYSSKLQLHRLKRHMTSLRNVCVMWWLSNRLSWNKVKTVAASGHLQAKKCTKMNLRQGIIAVPMLPGPVAGEKEVNCRTTEPPSQLGLNVTGPSTFVFLLPPNFVLLSSKHCLKYRKKKHSTTK